LTAGVTGTLPVANGGTALTALGTANQVLAVNAGATALEYQSVGTGSVTSVDVSGGTTGLTTSGGPVTGSGTITVAGTLAVANGGTGATTLTANNVLLGNGTSAPQAVAPSTTGNVLTSNGTTWQSTAPAGGGGGTVTSVGGTGTVNGIALTGTVTSSGNLTLGGTLSGVNLTSQVTGTLPVANGGTGTTATTFANLTTNVTGTLPVANGGTGVTTKTGTGAVVLGSAPTITGATLVTPVLGTPSSGNLSACTVDGTDEVGFRNIPQNSQSAAYTLVLADAGKHIYHPTTDAVARTFTIPSNASVAYPIGTAITFVNMTTQVVTIAITTDTMYLSDAGTTGSRSLARYGSATALKLTSTTWLISGSGLT
tara:strand:- start:208 stop:1314 length:1107 start_codon:yes stop_codon:yes gene_type:complete